MTRLLRRPRYLFNSRRVDAELAEEIRENARAVWIWSWLRVFGRTPGTPSVLPLVLAAQVLWMALRDALALVSIGLGGGLERSCCSINWLRCATGSREVSGLAKCARRRNIIRPEVTR